MNPDSLPSFDEWRKKAERLQYENDMAWGVLMIAQPGEEEAYRAKRFEAKDALLAHLAAHPSAAPQGAQPVQEPVAEHCMCEFCKDGAIHASDCSVHNEPALPIKPCDCHLAHLQPVAWQDPNCPRHVISAEDMRDFTRPVLNGPVTIANAKKHTRPLFAAPQPAPTQPRASLCEPTCAEQELGGLACQSVCAAAPAQPAPVVPQEPTPLELVDSGVRKFCEVNGLTIPAKEQR